MNEKLMNISIEQAKLLGNALRIKIISKLVDSPKTAKQVAVLLGQSGGNIHYHIKKLYEGDLLELVEEKKVGGVTEKYYQSKGKWFNSIHSETIDPVLKEGFNASESTALSIRLNLSSDQKEQMTEEFKSFLEKWIQKSSVSREKTEYREYSIGVKIVSTKNDDKEGVIT